MSVLACEEFVVASDGEAIRLKTHKNAAIVDILGRIVAPVRSESDFVFIIYGAIQRHKLPKNEQNEDLK